MVKSFRKPRALFAIIFLFMLTMVVVALRQPTTQAAPAGNCTYYSNASHTTVVGQYGKDCCNNTVAWGIKTKFSVCGGCFVCTPPPR